jgi:P27 family predicted phage terminase small subunit
MPAKPADLPAVAGAAWDEISDELDKLGLLARIDGRALEAACVAYAHARFADREIERLQAGAAGVGDKHELCFQVAAWNQVSKKAWLQFKGFGVEFGLTPASRCKLKVGDLGKSIDLEAGVMFG